MDGIGRGGVGRGGMRAGGEAGHLQRRQRQTRAGGRKDGDGGQGRAEFEYEVVGCTNGVVGLTVGSLVGWLAQSGNDPGSMVAGATTVHFVSSRS